MFDNLNNVKDDFDSARDEFIRRQGRRRPRVVLFIKLIAEFVRDMNDDNVGLYAAQAAFYSLLSAVPFLMLIIHCLKFFINVDTTLLVNTVRSTFPVPISTYINGVLLEVFSRSESIALLSATLVTAVWISSKGIMAIYMGLNSIYGYTKNPNWIAARFVSVFYDVVFIVVIVGSIVCLVFGNTVLHLFRDYLSGFTVVWYAFEVIFRMKYIIFFVLFILAFTGIYSFLPQKKVKFLSQVPGATAIAVGWMGFSYIFSLYITYFSRYSLLYGSLTAIVFLMLWIFFCIYMLLIGAEINTHIQSGYFGRMHKILFGKRHKNKKSS